MPKDNKIIFDMKRRNQKDRVHITNYKRNYYPLCQNQHTKRLQEKSQHQNKRSLQITSRKNRAEGIRLSEIIVYIVSFTMVILIVGTTLNQIQLHMAIKQVVSEGIDYDFFREMLLPEGIIEKAKKQALKKSQVEESIQKQPSLWEEENYITLIMLLNQNKLIKGINLSDNNSTYLLKHLSDNAGFLELKGYYKAILNDIKVFPVEKNKEEELVVTFEDSWNSFRSYGGNRRHEGTDLMPRENVRGIYKVLSMTDGVVEKMGWLEQGGYRVGIRGVAGGYFYYAHLDSYAPELKIGDTIKAGEFLGFMGDSGYGEEGTKGMFDVHLHLGIYVDTPFGELSINPYRILLYMETK